MNESARTLVTILFSGVFSGVVVVFLTFYLNHRKGSHDSQRVQIEERQAVTEETRTETADEIAGREFLRSIAQVSQQQAEMDRKRANEAVERADATEHDVATLRAELDRLQQAFVDAVKRIAHLEDELRDVSGQLRIAQRANTALEGENTMLRDRMMMRGTMKRDKDSDPNMSS